MSSIVRSPKLYFLLLGLACVNAPSVANAATLTYSAGSPAGHAGAWQAATNDQSSGLVVASGVTLQMAAYDYPRASGRVSLTRPTTASVSYFDTTANGGPGGASASQAYGLQLPEPGTGSTLMATIALAAFFFVRRSLR